MTQALQPTSPSWPAMVGTATLTIVWSIALRAMVSMIAKVAARMSAADRTRGASAASVEVITRCCHRSSRQAGEAARREMHDTAPGAAWQQFPFWRCTVLVARAGAIVPNLD